MPGVRPYTRFHYSNIGFGLLGRTLEKAANRDSALRRGQNSVGYRPKRAGTMST